MRFVIDFLTLDDNFTKYLRFEVYWKTFINQHTGLPQKAFLTVFEIKSEILEWLDENQINYKIWTPVTYEASSNKTKITDWHWASYVFDFDNQGDLLKFQLRWL